MNNDNRQLYDQLIKLGDMMGDGLHLEPDGEWIKKEYRKILRSLGLLPKKTVHRDSSSIDKFMVKRVETVKCNCGGDLKQTRKGAFIAQCVVCGNKYRLGSRKKRKEG